MALQPRRLNLKYNGAESVGFIAQEVQQVFPDTVDDSNPEELSLAQGEFMPYIIKAMQEQQAQIESLKSENNELKQRLEALEPK